MKTPSPIVTARSALIFLFNRIGIGKKLLLVYAISIVLPLAFCGVYFTITMSDIIKNREIEQAKINVRRLETIINDILGKATDVADRTYVNPVISRIINTRFESSLQAYESYIDFSFFDDYLRSYNEIQNIRLFVDNETLLNNSFFIKADDEVRSTEWYKRALRYAGRIFYTFRYDDLSRRNHISLVREIRSTTGEHLGVLCINFRMEPFSRWCAEEPFETRIALNGGLVNFSEANSMGEIGIPQKKPTDVTEEYGADFPREEGVYVWRLREKKSLVIADVFRPRQSQDSLLQIVYVIPEEKLYQPIYGMMLNSAIVFILAFGVSLSIILMFTRYFRSRVNVLKHELNHAVQNDFVMSQSMDGHDEIAELYASVDVMMWKTRRLIQEVYVAKIRQEQLAASQKDIQFKMLSSQINPHFLYNTLETIRMKAVAEKQRDIARAVLLLSKILRHSLSATDRTVLLGVEIEVMRNYFEVQQLRFGNRFTYSIDIEPGLDTVRILPLLIQPIAENSFVHGLELKKEGGRIGVSVRSELAPVEGGKRTETRVRIVVADNGAGMDEATLGRISGKLKSGDSGDCEHIGLVNVNHRIRLFYGEEYGVSISSGGDRGTEVSFVIPMEVGHQS